MAFDFDAAYKDKQFMQLNGKTVTEVLDSVKVAINDLLSFIPASADMYVSDAEAEANGVGLNKPYFLHPDNVYGSIGGLTKLRLSSLIAFIFFLQSFNLSAQIVQRSGAPTLNPTTGAAYIWNDTLNKRLFQYKYPNWFQQGTIVRSSIPSDSIYMLPGNVTIRIKFTDCRIFHTGTQSYWGWTGSAWRNERSIVLDSLFAMNNVWTGKNTFADSLKADKGMISGGLIDTKGLNTEGSSTKAAASIKGVQKNSVIELTTNTTLDGTYNTIVGNPSSSDITFTLPTISADNAGWMYTISKKQTASGNIRITGSAFNHVIISPNSPIVIRQRNGTWVAE
jgi:hypothetical protein